MLADLGFIGVSFPEEYGGTKGTIIDQTIIVEELSRGFTALALIYLLGVCFGGITIMKHGHEDQKAKYMKKLLNGEIVFSLGMTEPGGGTDILGAMKTKAVKDGNRYIINGQKVFTTGAHHASHIVTLARTNSNPPKKSMGLTIFLVGTKSDGLELRKIEKLGSKSVSSFEVFFDNVSVDESSIIGEVDRGWYYILETLNVERILVASVSLGVAQAAFDDALNYSKERYAFGRPIGQFQAIQGYISAMATEIELARLITYKAAWMQSNNIECSLEASMAKMFASDCAVKVTDMGMRIMAGYGFTMEYDMQRYFRDARQYVFAPITNEMSKNFIAEKFGLPKSY
jgi:acyl-CoA dehydrogenase